LTLAALTLSALTLAALALPALTLLALLTGLTGLTLADRTIHVVVVAHGNFLGFWVKFGPRTKTGSDAELFPAATQLRWRNRVTNQ
jgi:hypothetical protein